MRQLLFFICILFLVACGSGASKKEDAFQQKFYYKNNITNFRVFVFIVDDGISLENMQSHGEKQMHTENSTTAVYYYYKSNADSAKYDITMAPDAFIAQEYACRPGCAAGYWKFPTGVISFIESPCE